MDYPDKTPANPKPRLRILIVEDDLVAVEILTSILRSTEHTAVAVGSAEDAIQKLNSDKDFDVVLLDYHLPGMNCKEFLEAIRNSENQKNNPNLWVIAHTAEQRADQIETLLAAGANDYLPKPIFPHMVVLKLLTAQYNTARYKTLKRRLTFLESWRASILKETQKDQEA